MANKLNKKIAAVFAEVFGIKTFAKSALGRWNNVFGVRIHPPFGHCYVHSRNNEGIGTIGKNLSYRVFEFRIVGVFNVVKNTDTEWSKAREKTVYGEKREGNVNKENPVAGVDKIAVFSELFKIRGVSQCRDGGSVYNERGDAV